MLKQGKRFLQEESMRLHVFILLCLVFLFPLSCAVNPVTGRQEFALISEEQEIRIGRDNDPVVLQKFGYYPDPDLQNYVRSIGETLAHVSHRPNLPFHFKVVDSPQVNAFALPGGYVYVTRGILAMLNDEAELAGVLGHEIGHVTERHSVQQLTVAMGLQLTSRVLSTAVQGGSGMQQLSDLILTGVMQGYGRRKEFRADTLGQDYMMRAGYDPYAAVEFLATLERIEKVPHDPVTHWLTASHPYAAERIEKAGRHAGELSLRPPAGRRGRDRYLARIDGMVYGGGERAGYLRAGVYQNRFFRVRCNVPPGWKVKTARDRWRAEVAKGGPRLNFRMVELEKTMDVDAFAVSVEKEAGLRPGELLDRKRRNGFDMLTVRYRVRGETGPLRVLGGYLVRGRTGLILQGVAEQSDAARMEEAGWSVLQSLRALSAEEARQIPVLRIRLHKVRAGDSFPKLARRFADDPGKAKEMAAINNMDLNARLRPGMTLKVIAYDQEGK